MPEAKLFSGLTEAGGESRIPHVRRNRVISSEEERFPDTEEVTSSILVSPTMISRASFQDALFL